MAISSELLREKSSTQQISRVTRVILAVTTGAAIGLIFSHLRAAWTSVSTTDFQVFYDSGRSWLDHTDLYATTAAFPNLNPPHFIAAFAALSSFPVKVALAIWLAINVGCGIAAVAMIFRILEIPRTRTTMQIALSAAGLCTGILVALEAAQITGILMLGMTTAWSAARRGSWRACGVLLGLLVSVKPFFALMLWPLLRRRQYVALVWAITTAAAALATGIALAGPASMERWIATGRLVRWFQHPANASFLGLLARAGTTSAVLWGSLSIAALVLSAAVLHPSPMLDVEWATFAVLSLLVSPLGWNYYVPVIAAPLLAVALSRRSVALAMLGFIWPIPLLVAIVPLTSWSILAIGSLQAWSLIAVWIAVLEPFSLVSRHRSRRLYRIAGEIGDLDATSK